MLLAFFLADMIATVKVVYAVVVELRAGLTKSALDLQNLFGKSAYRKPYIVVLSVESRP
jgi:hypothetical protein